MSLLSREEQDSLIGHCGYPLLVRAGQRCQAVFAVEFEEFDYNIRRSPQHRAQLRRDLKF